jgi:hypothetical protein
VRIVIAIVNSKYLQACLRVDYSLPCVPSKLPHESEVEQRGVPTQFRELRFELSVPTEIVCIAIIVPGVMELFRGLLGPPATDEDARFELLQGLFGGVAHEEVSHFAQELSNRLANQRNDVVPGLRETLEAKFEAAKRKGVRNPEAPSAQDTQNPAWSEYNLAKDAHKRATALLKHQEKALKAIQLFARTTGEEFPSDDEPSPRTPSPRKVVVQLRRAPAPVVEQPAEEQLSQLEEQYASQPEPDEDMEGIPEPSVFVPRGRVLPDAISTLLVRIGLDSFHACAASMTESGKSYLLTLFAEALLKKKLVERVYVLTLNVMTAKKVYPYAGILYYSHDNLKVLYNFNEERRQKGQPLRHVQARVLEPLAQLPVDEIAHAVVIPLLRGVKEAFFRHFPRSRRNVLAPRRCSRAPSPQAHSKVSPRPRRTAPAPRSRKMTPRLRLAGSQPPRALPGTL